MPTVIDDTIDVALSSDGQPVSFVWQRFLYTVTGQPQAYFRRLPPWWHGASPSERIDQELWRVTAVRDGAREQHDGHLYDLCRASDGWLLALSWE
ncbi:MAG: hypothetical protein ACTIA6_03320 [Pseudoclavibacter sp.]